MPRRFVRGTEYEGTPELVSPGMSIPKRAPRGLCNKGSGTPDPQTYVTGYARFQFYLTTDGQTRNDGGNPVTPVELSSFNSVNAQWGYSFPGGTTDINQWARAIQLPTNYDATRPIIVTLHVVQE